MLVFDLASLPYIFESLIINYPPTIRDAVPANMLYMMARFACLACNHEWLEELIVGATDTIEEAFFVRASPSHFYALACNSLLYRTLPMISAASSFGCITQPYGITS
jgi:hypothetical protein